MKIGIDARSIGKKICGVSRVSMNQIIALADIDKYNEYVIYTNDLNEIPGLPSNFKVVRTNCNRMNVLHDIRLFSILKKENLELFHVMHSWLPIFLPKKLTILVTISDIFTVTDANFFAKRRPLHRLMQSYFKMITWLTIKRAKTVFTISQYCKSEIQRVFKVQKKSIRVVYLAPGLTPMKYPALADRIVKTEYFFFIGNFRSYKNVPTLIKGYAQLLARNEYCVDLVIASNDDIKAILRIAKKLGINEKRIHFFFRPSDEVVDNLYRNARAFVFPSVQEGFGIPPLEAMSYGIPVIISDAEALLEISGSAALVFDRKSPDDLAMKMDDILNISKIRNDLICRGHACADQFTWGNSARQLKDEYESYNRLIII